MPRNKKLLPRSINKRSYTAFIICLIVYMLLIFRLVDIQVLKSENYKSSAEKQSTEKINLSSNRGIIYDRNYKPLTDREKKQIIVVSKEILNNDSRILNLVKEASNLSEVDIYKLFQEQTNSSMLEIETKKIDEDMKNKLKDNNIIVEEKTLRYSEDNLLAHTIGHLKNADNTGQLGIEKSMDDILSNSNEKYVSVFKAGDSGNTQNIDILKGGIKTIDESKEDKNIKLTIDYDIQKMVERILDKEENPTAVVISDVKSGEILSICSRPNFDQKNIAQYSDPSYTGKGVFINRATNATYPPASVFKLVVLYAALDNRVINDDYTYNCTGKVNIEGTKEVLHCHKKEGHGVQNIEQALANSCNTAFLDIAIKAGKDKIFESINTLHLDDKVNIGIEEKDSKIPKNIAYRNLAIGQGAMEFTLVQINQMTQIIANNGTYKPLYMYDSIIDNKKNKIKSFKTVNEEEIISPYTITRIKEMMKAVSEDGTAKELKDLKGGCGVKTGTAQSSLNNESICHGSITGFYPEEDAKYAITVIVEGTKDNSKPATPIFKEICENLGKKNS